MAIQAKDNRDGIVAYVVSWVVAVGIFGMLIAAALLAVWER